MIPMTQPPQLPWRDHDLQIMCGYKRLAVHIRCSESHTPHLHGQAATLLSVTEQDSNSFLYIFLPELGIKPRALLHANQACLPPTLYVSHGSILRNISR